MKGRATIESVERALTVHTEAGRVRGWLRKTSDRGVLSWSVDLFDYGPWSGGLKETAALVVGIRVGQLHQQREETEVR